jgi:DNA-binding transcriptional ArsR family regulator
MGNGSIEETGLLDFAVSRLVDLLPPTWGVSVIRDPRVGPRSQADAFVDLTAGDGTSVSYIVEVKPSRRLSAHALVDLVSQYAAASSRPGVVVTDYANPALRAACLDYGLGYIDRTGWVYLRSERPALFLNQQGATKAPRLPQGSSAMTRLNGPGAGQVVQTLFDTLLPVGVRDLAEAAGVSPGTVAKVLPVLEHAGVITRSESGRVVTLSHRGLLSRWTQDYDFVRSNRDVTWLLAPRGIDWVLTELRNLSTHGLADGPEARVAATGSLAARRLLPADTLSVTPLALASLYSSDPEHLAEQLRLRPATKATANVVLARPRDESVFHGPALDGYLRLVPRARILADLMTQGGRFVDEAEQLLDVLEPSEPTPYSYSP